MNPKGFSICTRIGGNSRAAMNRRIGQNLPAQPRVFFCLSEPVWFRLRRLRVGKIVYAALTRGHKQTSVRGLRKLDCAARTILPTRRHIALRAFAHPTTDY